MAPVLGTGGILVVVLLSRVLLTVADLASAGLALAVARTLPTGDGSAQGSRRSRRR